MSFSGGKFVRTFAAVNVSIPSVRAMTALQRRLREQQDRSELKMSWVPPANLHITLKFYGNLSREQVEGAEVALKNAADSMKPFRVIARGLGVFPNPEKPRVLWVGVEDPDGGLERLHQRLEESSAELGFARDKRDFHAHLTLGRIRRGNAGVREMLESEAEVDCLQSTVAEAVVYESRPRRAGAEYISHCRVELV